MTRFIPSKECVKALEDALHGLLSQIESGFDPISEEARRRDDCYKHARLALALLHHEQQMGQPLAEQLKDMESSDE